MTLSRRGVKKLWNHAHFTLDTATTARSPFTVLRTAPGDRGIFPRANKQSTGLFVAPVCGLVPPFQIPLPGYKKDPHRMVWVFFMAEKEGFELLGCLALGGISWNTAHARSYKVTVSWNYAEPTPIHMHCSKGKNKGNYHINSQTALRT